MNDPFGDEVPYPEVARAYEAMAEFLYWCERQGGSKEFMISMMDSLFKGIHKHLVYAKENGEVT